MNKKPTETPAETAKMPQFDPKTLGRLFSYMKEYKASFILVAVCILLSAVASAASALFIQILIDQYIVPLLGMNEPVFSGLIKALVTIGAVYLVGVVSTLIYNRVMVTIAQGTLKKIRDDMFAKMQRLPVRYFDTHTHGDTMSLYTNDTDTLRQMIAQSMAQLLSSVFTIVAVFICMLYISVWLTLVAVAVIFLILQLVKVITGKIGFYFMMQQETLANLNGYVEETVNGQKVVKVFCHEEQAKQEFREKNRAWAESASNANGHANGMMPMMNALGYVQYIMIAVIGAYMAIAKIPNLGLNGTGTLTLGMIASFLTLSRNFTNPISQISNQFNSIVTALAGASRIFEFMDEEPETDDGYVTLVNAREENGELTETAEHTGIWAWKHPHHDGTLTYTKVEGRVVLDHVDFGYVPEKEVLHDITLYAEPGQKIAFVGATGAGKTTITNLINRFYDIADGKIRYDGININKIKKADLRRSLGVVLQDVNLFTGTVMENLRYGNPDATDEECIAAAKLANADGFIRMLPQGYETVLKGDGSGLSQGQRQLISIARAAVSDPPVMILDEATSSIDTRTEALVQDGMDKLMKGRTVFVIAHRLSTVQNSDVIMVLDQGRIIERGNHDKLVSEKGTYYQLYTGAFELE
ncbi:MAG: ABC transporter ATP-binding protein [Lachnospiraceae bacterium]